MPDYVYDSSGVLTIHMSAADVSAGGIDLLLDINGDSLAKITPTGDLHLADSLIEDDILNLGEVL